MKIVCTNRGQHEPFELGEVLANGRHIAGPHWTHAGMAGNGRGEQFFCPLCGRNPQVKPDRLDALFDAALGAGIEVFDMSGLPF